MDNQATANYSSFKEHVLKSESPSQAVFSELKPGFSSDAFNSRQKSLFNDRSKRVLSTKSKLVLPSGPGGARIGNYGQGSTQPNTRPMSTTTVSANQRRRLRGKGLSSINNSQAKQEYEDTWNASHQSNQPASSGLNSTLIFKQVQNGQIVPTGTADLHGMSRHIGKAFGTLDHPGTRPKGVSQTAGPTKLNSPQRRRIKIVNSLSKRHNNYQVKESKSASRSKSRSTNSSQGQPSNLDIDTAPTQVFSRIQIVDNNSPKKKGSQVTAGLWTSSDGGRLNNKSLEMNSYLQTTTLKSQHFEKPKVSFIKKNVFDVNLKTQQIQQKAYLSCNPSPVPSMLNLKKGGSVKGYQLLSELIDQELKISKDTAPTSSRNPESKPTARTVNASMSKKRVSETQKMLCSSSKKTDGKASALSTKSVSKGIKVKKQESDIISEQANPQKSIFTRRKSAIASVRIKEGKKKELEQRISQMVQPSVQDKFFKFKPLASSRMEGAIRPSIMSTFERERERIKNEEELLKKLSLGLQETSSIETRSKGHYRGTVSQVTNLVLSEAQHLLSGKQDRTMSTYQPMTTDESPGKSPAGQKPSNFESAVLVNFQNQIAGSKKKRGFRKFDTLDAEASGGRKQMTEIELYNLKMKRPKFSYISKSMCQQFKTALFNLPQDNVFSNEKARSSLIMDNLFAIGAERVLVAEDQNLFAQLVKQISARVNVAEDFDSKTPYNYGDPFTLKVITSEGEKSAVEQEAASAFLAVEYKLRKYVEQRFGLSESTSILNSLLNLEMNEHIGRQSRMQSNLSDRLRKGEETKIDQVQLFREAYNKLAMVMQVGREPEVPKMDSQVTEFASHRILGSFFHIPSKGKEAPLHLALSHDLPAGQDPFTNQLGVLFIYWSRTTQYPCSDNNEGLFIIGSKAKDTKGSAEVYLSTIQIFGEKTFSSENVYVGVFSLQPDVKIRMTYSFKSLLCKAILKKEQGIPTSPSASKLQFEHKHADGEEIYNSNCRLCKMIGRGGEGKSSHTLGEYRREMNSYIEEMIGDKKRFSQFEDELTDVRHRMLKNRIRAHIDIEKNRHRIRMIEAERANTKPLDLTDQEFELQKCQQRKAALDLQHNKLKVFLAIRIILLNNFHREKISEGIRLGQERRNVRKILNIIKVQQIILILQNNFRVLKQKEFFKLRAKCAAIKIFLRLKRHIKKHGPTIEDRGRLLPRNAISFAETAIIPQTKRIAREKMAYFLRQKMKIDNLRVGCINFCKRIENIKVHWKKTIKVQRGIRRELTEFIDQAFDSLKSALLYQKKLKSQFPELLSEITAINQSDSPFKELIIDEFLNQQKYFHLINLIRWYGLFKNEGKYNKDAFFSLLDKLVALKEKNFSLDQIINSRYPSKDILRKIAAQQAKKEHKEAARNISNSGLGTHHDGGGIESTNTDGNKSSSKGRGKMKDFHTAITLKAPKMPALFKDDSRNQEEKQTLSLAQIIGDKPAAAPYGRRKSLLLDSESHKSNLQRATAVFMLAKTKSPREIDKLLQQDQAFKQARLDEHIIRTFFEGYEFPWEELDQLLLPSLQIYLNLGADEGDLGGNRVTVLQLAYRCLALQFSEKEKVRKQEGEHHRGRRHRKQNTQHSSDTPLKSP